MLCQFPKHFGILARVLRLPQHRQPVALRFVFGKGFVLHVPARDVRYRFLRGSFLSSGELVQAENLGLTVRNLRRR